MEEAQRDSMGTSLMRNLPLVLATAAFMLGGSARVIAAGTMDHLAAALLAAGLILLGVWIKDDEEEK